MTDKESSSESIEDFEYAEESYWLRLEPAIAELVAAVLARGKYASRMEVLRKSEELKAWREDQIRAFDEELARRLATPKDQYLTIEEAFGPLLAKIQAEEQASDLAESQPAEYGERRSVGPQDPGTELRSAESA
ncbi:hypothetical protein [Roseateles sp. L2-2]|uniref:hypothetical protein n=1 Tax=Roseateles TaxID=93681 RepID=UPI003D36B46B